MSRALLLVDIQNDFMPGGPLAAPNGDEVVPVANALAAVFPLVVATRDWHPSDHLSFASNHEGHDVGEVIDLDGVEQILWPDHCVQESEGADFAPSLDVGAIDKVVYKGVDKEIDSYSTFYDNAHRRDTGLADYLREQGIETLFIVGVATEYCVLYSVRDAVEEGFEVVVVEDGIAGIEMEEGDVAAAKKEMRDLGARFVASRDVLQGERVGSGETAG